MMCVCVGGCRGSNDGKAAALRWRLSKEKIEPVQDRACQLM
jgi:hypothetical protein